MARGKNRASTFQHLTHRGVFQEEMRTNLPKEMNFVHEAANAARAVQDFENINTSLYIPKVLTANKRVLIMEYIQGGRVDDLNYLAEFSIDRNKVALELSRIFNQMVFVNGFFHAVLSPYRYLCLFLTFFPGPTPRYIDLYHYDCQIHDTNYEEGNLLIRPRPAISSSPYNFEIVLLDHGLYFDMDNDLRVNYSKLWLSLIAAASPEVNAERRKYAQLVGNIGSDLVS